MSDDLEDLFVALEAEKVALEAKVRELVAEIEAPAERLIAEIVAADERLDAEIKAMIEAVWNPWDTP